MDSITKRIFASLDVTDCPWALLPNDVLENVLRDNAQFIREELQEAVKALAREKQ